MATHLNNLAELLRATNRLAEAEPLYQRALAIVLAAYSAKHPDTQTVAANYRSLLAAMGWSEAQIEEKLHEVLSGGGGGEARRPRSWRMGLSPYPSPGGRGNGAYAFCDRL